MSVQRYEPSGSANEGCVGFWMEPSTEGAFVKFEEYEKLLNELNALKQHIKTPEAAAESYAHVLGLGRNT